MNTDLKAFNNPYTIVEDLHSVLCYIQTQIITQDDTGSTTKVWENRYATIGYDEVDTEFKCMITENKEMGKEGLASPYVLATHIIYFNPDIEVNITDRIMQDGVVYDVLAIQFMTTKELTKVYVKQIIQ